VIKGWKNENQSWQFMLVGTKKNVAFFHYHCNLLNKDWFRTNLSRLKSHSTSLKNVFDVGKEKKKRE
jgi:hypothetical protein